MADNPDPRFSPLADGSPSASASSTTSPPISWTIRIISKQTPEGRNFFHDHYRPFRLKMLKEAPYAYTSTYQRTAVHTPEQWDARWSTPNATHFIALLSPLDPNSNPKIISALTLRGPFPTSELTSPVWQQFGTAGCSSYWEINGVFTDEAYRRLGVARSVMEEVVRMVERERRGEKTLMTLGVLAGNEEAVGVYEKAGFVDRWPDGGGWEMVRFLGGGEGGEGVGFGG
ncbi:hypothetical protein QBC34DRAFT_61604 [Podospora aff. communis PSN243]|uniref:N-acetyltransferase domain-containing protein n=1 Tax=Podospora aff. communis PSN243 TaxID=3040156 RepID=A0AAV9GS32_9PEZI|nr:hypothetical protein QBC34DRAFT_61604 [Podospora aff. communis PSN243]